jgi:hypothetical protein
MVGYPAPIQWFGLPQWLANYFGVPVAFGTLLAVLLVFGVCWLPLFIMKTNAALWIVVSVLGLTILTGSGWLPNYMWLFLIVYIAINLSRHYKDLF